MRSTTINQSGMPTGKKFMGWWGDMGGLPQKRITQYSLSEYRQNPMQGAFKHSLFQGTTRVLKQVPYVVPPFVIAYVVMQWAGKKNEYYNSKAGHLAGESA